MATDEVMAASAPAGGALETPVSTLYCSNIDWKIKKQVLRRSLHALFSRHGKVRRLRCAVLSPLFFVCLRALLCPSHGSMVVSLFSSSLTLFHPYTPHVGYRTSHIGIALWNAHYQILEIVTLRRDGLRGQAWVIFEDVAAATAALNAENGFSFFGRPIKVSYAREKSDRVAKMDGTFVPKDRREKRRKRDAESVGGSPAKQPRMDGGGQVAVEDPSALVGEDGPAAAAGAPPPPPPPPPPAAPAQEEALPSKILFAQDLPPECNEMMLAMLFRQHVGYKEVRIPRPGLAFVEFEDEPHATLALKALNGFKLTTTETLKLTYGKS